MAVYLDKIAEVKEVDSVESANELLGHGWVIIDTYVKHEYFYIDKLQTTLWFVLGRPKRPYEGMKQL